MAVEKQKLDNKVKEMKDRVQVQQQSMLKNSYTIQKWCVNIQKVMKLKYLCADCGSEH